MNHPLTGKEALRERLLQLHRRTERVQGVAFFLGGFSWDALTLTRIDRLLDNLILLAYLIALGALIVLHRRLEIVPERWPRLAEKERWLGFAIQFFFGGLFSGYFIFYSKSASVGRSLLFVGLLLALMLANEFLHHRLRGERLRVGLFTLCAFSFLLFFIPVITGWLGTGVFSIAGVLAFGLGMLVAFLGGRHPELPDFGRKALRQQVPVVAGVLATMFLLDLLHLIPPVPLALMQGGIYHNVERVPGGYALTWEDSSALPWREDARRFLYHEGDKAWCFTAIFAPTGASLDIVHRWERWDDQSDEWLTTDRIPFDIRGGREHGYRGYTRKASLSPGEWRVRVETADGRELGRYPFEIVPVAVDPEAASTEGAEPERDWKRKLAD